LFGTEVVCGVRAESVHQRDHLILEQLPNTGRITGVTALEVLHHYSQSGHADWEGVPPIRSMMNSDNASPRPCRQEHQEH
jgi:hypothetical protein